MLPSSAASGMCATGCRPLAAATHPKCNHQHPPVRFRLLRGAPASYWSTTGVRGLRLRSTRWMTVERAGAQIGKRISIRVAHAGGLRLGRACASDTLSTASAKTCSMQLASPLHPQVRISRPPTDVRLPYSGSSATPSGFCKR